MDTQHYPIILVSKNSEILEKYIAEFIYLKKISPYYIYRIIPEKTELGIEEVREVKFRVNESVGENVRLFIFEKFNSASLEAQNALLKTLEESTNNNCFLMITDEIEKILPTIQSRSQIQFLNDTMNDSENVNSINEIKKLLSDIRKSSDYSFLGSPLITKLTKEQASLFLRNLLVVVKGEYSSGNQELVAVTKKILRLKKLVENNNLNVSLAVDNLLIFIHKVYKLKE